MKQRLSNLVLVGKPNVGKSSLFNRVAELNRSVVTNIPGTTRDSISVTCQWGGAYFTLIDLPGLDDLPIKQQNEIDIQSKLQINKIFIQADVFIYLIDIDEGLTKFDIDSINNLRKFNKPILPVINKIDNFPYVNKINNLPTDLEPLIAISAIHGKNISELLNKIIHVIPNSSITIDLHLPKITIIGRPNVGKSTLMNKILSEDRSIVSDEPGTTRDSVEDIILIEGKYFNLIDTAGIRKKGKIQPSTIERFSVIQAFKQIDSSDIVLIVVDAMEGITRQDSHLVSHAQEGKKKIIVVINKIDVLDDIEDEKIKSMLDRYPFISRLDSVCISAKTGKNLDKLKHRIVQISS